MLGLRVDLQLPAAEPATDVGIVDHEHAAVAFLDVGIGPFAALHRLNEVLLVGL